jgi:alpha-L-rhamnosidase
MRFISAVLIPLILFLFVEVESGFANSFSEVTNSNEYFKEAKPIWPVGKELEKNFSIRLQSSFEVNNTSNVKLAITGSSLYRIYLNNEFLGHGPARAAHGFYRVDEIDLSNKVKKGMNQLRIEVAGYNANSYYLLDQPSFVQAEVTDGLKVLVATKKGAGGIQITQITERLQKVPRYSFQRPFIEVYNLNPNITLEKTNLVCEEVDAKQLIDRRIEFADFDEKEPVNILASGKVKTGQKQTKYWKDRAVLNISDKLGGFPESELVTNPAIELQEIEEESRVEEPIPYLSSKAIHFKPNGFQIIDFGLNNTGFIGAQINCKKPCKVYFTFDEILVEDDVDFKRLGCINSVTYNTMYHEVVLCIHTPLESISVTAM